MFIITYTQAYTGNGVAQSVQWR